MARPTLNLERWKMAVARSGLIRLRGAAESINASRRYITTNKAIRMPG